MPSMMKEIGAIGQRRYAGIFSEEFLKELQGKRGIEIYREMSDAQRLFLLEEDMHEFACCHGLGDKRHLSDMLCYLGEMLEQFGGVDIANDMVDIPPIDNHLGVSTLDELVSELFDRTILYIDGVNLRTRHHTVTHLRIGEIEGIMEHFHLVLNLCIVLGIVEIGRAHV